MSYHVTKAEIACNGCGAPHWVTITYAGYGPGNEWTSGHCKKCGSEIAREECGLIVTELIAKKTGRSPAAKA
jgi:7-cyano-7-deazaguanine synthase in queuosine biosynthesis